MAANPYLTGNERALLERARFGIAGAGGLGSNCCAHLVRAGVKRLVIADYDVVSESNLNRQFFFRDQLGMKKTEALAQNLRRIEPELDIELVDERLDESGFGRVFAGCDVVVEALDSAAAKHALYTALAGRRVVGASGLGGWGRSADMKVRRIGGGMVLIGDFESDVTLGAPPQSPRVGIAAAMEANAAIALVLGLEP